MSFENIYIQTSDRVKLHAMFIRKPDISSKPRTTVLYLHGNAGNIGHQLVCAKGLHVLCGFNVLLLEYRGYGKSEGYPSEYGFRKDVQAALEFLLSRDDVCRNQIVIFGRSIGGAVALDIAADPRFRALLTAVVVENTFTSIGCVAALYLSWTRWLPYWMFRDKYNSISKVPRIQCAALFLSGEVDELVPCSMMTELFQATTSTMKCIERFPTGTHNTTWRCPKYHESIARFIHHVVHARADHDTSLLSNQGPPDTGLGHTDNGNDGDSNTDTVEEPHAGMTLLDIWGSGVEASAHFVTMDSEGDDDLSNSPRRTRRNQSLSDRDSVTL